VGVYVGKLIWRVALIVFHPVA